MEHDDKYLFMYISKGADRVRYVIQKDVLYGDVRSSNSAGRWTDIISEENECINEIKNYLEGEYICPHEAA